MTKSIITILVSVQTTFVVLKLTGIIHWSWHWVCGPAIIVLIFYLVLTILFSRIKDHSNTND
jgi:hypothetical protein